MRVASARPLTVEKGLDMERGQATNRIAGKYRVRQGDRDCRPKSRIWTAYVVAAFLRVLRRAL